MVVKTLKINGKIIYLNSNLILFNLDVKIFISSIVFTSVNLNMIVKRKYMGYVEYVALLLSRHSETSPARAKTQTTAKHNRTFIQVIVKPITNCKVIHKKYSGMSEDHNSKSSHLTIVQNIGVLVHY